MGEPAKSPAQPAAAPEDRVACPVERDTDRFSVQHEARWLAERVGFPRRTAIELAIVASELATNILKYGVRGSVVIEAIDDPVRGRGVKVTAFDEGPPFTDFERALSDRSDENGPISASQYASRRGLGSGLGAVRRLSDACGWEPVTLEEEPRKPPAQPATTEPQAIPAAPEPRGKKVWALRWLRRR